jgi:hypothetical protein
VVKEHLLLLHQSQILHITDLLAVLVVVQLVVVLVFLAVLEKTILVLLNKVFQELHLQLIMVEDLVAVEQVEQEVQSPHRQLVVLVVLDILPLLLVLLMK